MWLVASWKSFRVLAADAEDARAGSRALAHQLERDGDRGLGVGVSGTELAITAPRIGMPGVTRTLTVQLGEPTAFAIEQIEQLRPADNATALVHALHVSELLENETAGERFFQEFRQLHKRMADSLGKRGNGVERNTISLLALTRILFLYFIQAKGWLDGNPRYLRNLLDRALEEKRHFHRTALNPLFFGTLNKPRSTRERNGVRGAIPYLNGGLFEPHPVELRLAKPTFSNDLWRLAFDTLFERFRFCVREADEVDAIAPDMLGRVFERVMDAGERHASGTFYTPKDLVNRVVERALEAALRADGEFDPSTVQAIIRGTLGGRAVTARALERLRGLRILDPAVGSGAFLLGALEILTRIHCELLPVRTAQRRMEIRLEILRHNLFGVDINPLAVRLAELRLWLAIVSDDPTRDPLKVSPLPNLDGIVRQGDSLFDPIAAARALDPSLVMTPAGVARKIERARHTRFNTRGKRGHTVRMTLRTAELDLARSILATIDRRVTERLRELDGITRNKDLFGKKTRLSDDQLILRRRLTEQLEAVERWRRRLEQDTVPFFSFDTNVPDVMARGGFDIVIGNPPWVRAERLTREIRNALGRRYVLWRPSSPPPAGRRGYTHLPDLAVAFLERALELTRNNGVVALLLPSKIASATYASTARRHLVRETSLEYLHRISEDDARRFNASAYPFVLVTRKHRPGRKHVVALDLDGAATLRQKSLDQSGPWVLVPDRTAGAIEEFRTSGQPLGRIVKPALGVKTGADRIFVGKLVREEGRTALVQFSAGTVRLETAVLKPALRGRDVGAFEVRGSRVIVFTHDETGTILPLPPRARHYLRANRPVLIQRSDYRSGPPETLFRVAPSLGRHRVVWPDICNAPRAALIEETALPDAVPLNTCYVAAASDRETALAITAVLNTTWVRALLLVAGDEARGGYRRMNARVAMEVPIPASPTDRSALAELSLETHFTRDVDQDIIDDAVAQGLGLSSRTRNALRTVARNHGGRSQRRA